MDVGGRATQEQLPRTVYGLFVGQHFIDSTTSHPCMFMSLGIILVLNSDSLSESKGYRRPTHPWFSRNRL